MDKFTLAIETSVKAGSLALLNGLSVIDSWIGGNEVSRSQDLLPQIARLFENTKVELKQLQRIVVSIGPGSFTGIRVGIATAQGLALASGCQLTGVSIFEALAFANQSTIDNKSTAVVSAGRDHYFWQSFGNGDSRAEPGIGDAALLGAEIEKLQISEIAAERNAYENLAFSSFKFLSKTKKIEVNYAELIGRCALEKNCQTNAVVPLYIRPAVIART